jgi:RimJ/RimL family protein N-acetyltransferase/ribosomal protein S18 acetylase RimI-like enzyme
MSLPTPTLRTARLLLRPFTEADTAAIFALHSSPRVLRYWDAPPWIERARAERFIAVCKQIEQEGSGARLAIERTADGVFIGWCCLVKWNPDYRSATMGYCLDDAAWGQGFATEAAGSMLQWGFDTLQLNRVQAETDTRNAASARVLEKLGFVREGTLREDCIVNGEASDSWVYGLLRRQWKPLQSRSMSDPPRIRTADSADAEALSALAERTFRDTFANDNSADDMDAYVRDSFSLDRVRVELADDVNIFLLAFVDGAKQPTGYAKLRAGTTDPSVTGPDPVELQRLYVDRSAIARGVGAALMRASLATARAAGHRTLWLGVWERNAPAISFYEKWNFETVGGPRVPTRVE